MLTERNLKMRKISVCILILSISVFSLEGCSTDKPFVKRVSISDLSSKVVRHQTPNIKKIGLGTAFGFIIGGAIAANVVSEIESKKFRDQMTVPDFGQLLMERFVERAEKEISDFPKMMIENKPIDGDLIYGNGILIIFKVDQLMLDFSKLVSVSKIRMENNQKEVLWQKTFGYSSKKFSRKVNLEELKVGNIKSLRDEMEFAVETTVSDFIKHFREGK
jgi:hypothetical protein